ncbi:DUF2759 domain-containing protein [Alkalihalobacillus trypoxylicola]|uniref:Alkaliphily related protein n=1 Tax=Alkalihalobacillus trypoxylicola TaxID=519424 RepID=A0A162DVN9_9BACI|nr:DUF2759 domain-containing protein [Alkalihalobacillus trypoxylicola]KYG30980.1 hypothetical protein AZF04_18460 [Alkalihalobacillus trypoxylicola]
MFLAITLLLVSIICLIAVFREIRRKNFFAVGFALISCAVFGWFSVRTILAIIITNSGAPGIGS